MRNLGLLWVGQFVSQIGDGFFQITLPFLVLLIAGEGASTKAGLVMLANFVPFLVIGPFAGALADRRDRKGLMIASDAARACIVLALPAAFLAGALSWPLVATVAFLLATAATCFNPARDALVPSLAEGRTLLRVNAAFQVSAQLSYIVGAIGVGLLLGLDEKAVREAVESGDVARPVGGIVRLYWANSLAYALSLTTLVLVAVPRLAVASPARATSPLSDVAAGLTHAFRSSLLSGLLFVTAADNFFIMGPAIIGVALLVKNTCGLGPGHVAVLEAALGMGWLAGTLVLLRWGRGWPKGKILLAGMFLDGLTYVPFFWIRDFGVFVAAIAFHGFWIPFIQVPRTTLVQERVPRELLGRIFSLINLTFVGFTALSLMATGWLGDRVDPPVLFLLGGAGGALCGLVGTAFGDLRRSR